MKEKILAALESSQADYTEIRLEEREATSVIYRGDDLEAANGVNDTGGVVRCLVKRGGWGIATFNDMTMVFTTSALTAAQSELNFENGADVTGENTAADTYYVNGLESTTLIQAGFIGTNLVVSDSIVAGQISADRFTVALEGDLNQALYYVKQVLATGADYEKTITDADLAAGAAVDVDADTHADYGISLRLATAALWDDGVTDWDDGTYWDITTETTGTWTSASQDMGASKTLGLALRGKLYETFDADTSIAVKVIFSTDNVNWGTNGTLLNDDVWEKISGIVGRKLPNTKLGALSYDENLFYEDFSYVVIGDNSNDHIIFSR